MNDIITIRASSLGDLFDCPARWAARHIDGMRTPSNGKATIGRALHASTAVYDQSTIDGSGITIEESASAAVDAITHPVEDVVWGDDSPADAEKIALSLHEKYCRQIAPLQQYTAVEMVCEKLEISDLRISLSGATDRIRKVAEGNAICDLKTGRSAVGIDGTVKTAGHAFQMGVYELLAQHSSGMPIVGPAQIIAMNTAKTPAAQRIGTGEIVGARDALLGDGETPGVLEYASRIIHSGSFFGNPKSMMCGPVYCSCFSTCRFRK